MDAISTWLPLSLGSLIVIAICYKVFTDKNVTNYLGYGLIAALLLCALPSLQHLDYKGSFGQLTADLAQKSSTVNNQVVTQSADLQKQITLIDTKVNTIVDKLNAKQEVEATITSDYQKNGSSEVLVYFAAAEQSQASKIRDYLLSLGYKSSAAFTDFSELSPPLPPAGTIRLVATSDLVDLANSIQTKLHDKFPSLKLLPIQQLSKLNAGDIQVELF